MITQPIQHPKAYWTVQNPILDLGVVGSETDTYLSKIGDGSTAWNDLGYQIPPMLQQLPEFQSGVDNQTVITGDGISLIAAPIVPNN